MEAWRNLKAAEGRSSKSKLFARENANVANLDYTRSYKRLVPALEKLSIIDGALYAGDKSLELVRGHVRQLGGDAVIKEPAPN